ncbi:MAG: Hpt domain-containing protein [Hyphomicrobium sp.]|uniref:Hpt domain-containing protein n=1 Tax=Hyphomicrobium sp. TaxID=82 RepID=UPI0039E37370
MDVPQVRSFDLHRPDKRQDAGDLPVDLAHLDRYTLGDKALEAEVLGLYLGQLSETIAALRSAVTARDWKIAAHTLKGSSRAVGAWRIATLAENAEGLASGGGTTARSEAISKLEAAASEASAFVEKTAIRA